MSDHPFTLKLGSPAPDFNLLGTEGQFYTLNHFAEPKALVIFFTCNHCPYVFNSDEITRKTVEKYQKSDVAFVGINSNSQTSYPEDSYEKMVERMHVHHFPWIYLRDKSQTTALAYGALRTPHFFIFDNKRLLIYTGRATDSPRNSSKITINDLENALDDYLQDQPLRKSITNPIGCNIKWEGKDKHWMPDEACNLV